LFRIVAASLALDWISGGGNPMRLTGLAIIISVSLLSLTTGALAQNIRVGPGGVEINPRREVEPPPPPARRGAPPRDELRERMMEYRGACEDGDKRSCVRLGILIGENREKRAQWRREHPEVFFYER
jgi:hypothetical protein